MGRHAACEAGAGPGVLLQYPDVRISCSDDAAVTLLVFLARAAGTGVVATDLGSFTGDGTGRGRRCRLALRLLCLILDPRRCFMLELHALGQLLGRSEERRVGK